MKVLGKTTKGYIVEITVEEIGVVTGFGKYPLYGPTDQQKAFRQAVGLSRDGQTIPSGAEIAVIAGLDFIEALRSKTLLTQKTANDLRQLADMLDTAIPEVLIPPAGDSNA